MSDANKNSSCKHVLMITYLVSGGKRTQGSPGQNQGEVKRKGTYCRWVPGTEKASGREELSWASTSLVLSLWATTEATCFTMDQPVFSVLALSAVGFRIGRFCGAPSLLHALRLTQRIWLRTRQCHYNMLCVFINLYLFIMFDCLSFVSYKIRV